jgi:hypothetical protein
MQKAPIFATCSRGARTAHMLGSSQMALVDLGKQLAQQAILSATTKDPPPLAGPAADQTGAIILGQVGAMQKALKEDEELVVLFQTGAERLRVMEIYLPSPQVAVLSAVDANRSMTRVIAPVPSLQLLCRVAKVQPGAKPSRVGLITAKPKDSTA